jgi:murein DD-endopeptidase MepM/ murein hydrolase activator NlpD
MSYLNSVVHFRLALVGLAAIVLANCTSTRARIDAERPQNPTSYVVTVREGDTLPEIAERYRVPMNDILAMNGIGDPDRIATGQQIQVPAYGLTGAAPQYVAALNPALAYQAPAAAPAYGSNPYSGGAYGGAATPSYTATVPQTYSSSGIERSELPAPPATGAPQALLPQPYTPAQPAPSAYSGVAMPATTAVLTPPPAPALAPVLASGRFMWPVQGRVLSAFGAGTNGERNDGINIAAPRGTPIHAAASGTVTYVGNELRGFGNLVLIRHDGGYVTAYAHADEITVARGDSIKAGQVIGRLGATGDVTEPQLHFEIREGTRPVNPLGLLDAAAPDQASLTPSDPAKS